LAIVQQLCFVGDILLLSSPDVVFQSNVFDFFYKHIRQAFLHGKIWELDRGQLQLLVAKFYHGIFALDLLYAKVSEPLQNDHNSVLVQSFVLLSNSVRVDG
jgi:hypothetical protein